MEFLFDFLDEFFLEEDFFVEFLGLDFLVLFLGFFIFFVIFLEAPGPKYFSQTYSYRFIVQGKHKVRLD